MNEIDIINANTFVRNRIALAVVANSGNELSVGSTCYRHSEYLYKNETIPFFLFGNDKTNIDVGKIAHGTYMFQADNDSIQPHAPPFKFTLAGLCKLNMPELRTYECMERMITKNDVIQLVVYAYLTRQRM